MTDITQKAILSLFEENLSLYNHTRAENTQGYDISVVEKHHNHAIQQLLWYRLSNMTNPNEPIALLPKLSQIAENLKNLTHSEYERIELRMQAIEAALNGRSNTNPFHSWQFKG